MCLILIWAAASGTYLIGTRIYFIILLTDKRIHTLERTRTQYTATRGGRTFSAQLAHGVWRVFDNRTFCTASGWITGGLTGVHTLYASMTTRKKASNSE